MTGPLAGAQEDGVTVAGLVWFDRNANEVVDAGEPPLANGRGVRVFNADTKEFIGEYGTDANGRYRAEGLPDVRLAIYNHNTDIYEATTDSTFNPVSGGGTFDFGIRGGTVRGFSFLDGDRDGMRQSHEADVPGAPTLRLLFDTADVAPPTRGVNGEYEFTDVPLGSRVSVVADRAPELKPAQPLTEHDVDPVTRRKDVVVRAGQTTRVDVRYTHLDADFVVGEPRLEPAGDAYRVGDVVSLVVPVTNRGEAEDKPSIVVFGSTPEFVGAGDAVVVRHPGQDFETRDTMAVGQTVDIRLTYRLDDPEFDRFHLFVRPVSALAHREVNVRDNHAIVPLKYSSGETTTPTTPTTTTPAVVRVAGGDGLARTGVTPFPAVAIGGLLLGGGVLTFLAARRRRRA